MSRSHLPTRTLAERPDFEQLKRQAKELLQAFKDGDPSAAAEVHGHYRDADPAAFALHEAQLVIARAYGFDSWPKLKAFVDGATVRRLTEAVKAGNIDAVGALLRARPELARMSVDNLGVIHHAVLARAPEIVRTLMAHGADARQGVYPYRDATTAHAIALQRGYDEIVRIIEAEEQKRRDTTSGAAGTRSAEGLFQAIGTGDSDRAIAMLLADPALIHARSVRFGATPLHAAALALDASLVTWLLDHGADPAGRDLRGITPLDMAAHRWYKTDTGRMKDVATRLLAAGAPMTASAAAALGDADWLGARHREGTLKDLNDGDGGLLRIAVTHDRTEILELLLEIGFDPDERIRLSDNDGAPFSWGMALQAAVDGAQHEMAEKLLKRGADPNALIYATGDPTSSAYAGGDERMIALLQQYGGRPAAGLIASLGRVDLATQILEGTLPIRHDTADSLPQQLLDGASRAGAPEIVRLALERLDWPREDPRWFAMLEQTLRHDSTDVTTAPNPYLQCFRLLLVRCDPNMRGRTTDGQQFGLTTLHNIVARGGLSPEERVAFASAILDAGARLDIRDHLLKSTPLGWACRWGQLPLVTLLLEHGADPVEAEAEPWARPRAWALRMGHGDVAATLDPARPPE